MRCESGPFHTAKKWMGEKYPIDSSAKGDFNRGTFLMTLPDEGHVRWEVEGS